MENTIIFVVEPRLDTIIEENEDEIEQIDTSIPARLDTIIEENEQIDDSNKKSPCVCEYLTEEDITRFSKLNINDDI